MSGSDLQGVGSTGGTVSGVASRTEMSGRLGSDGVEVTMDSPTSVPDIGNSGMDEIDAAGGRDGAAAEDGTAAAADVIPVQEEETRGTKQDRVCRTAALVSIPNKSDMYRTRTCATRHGCALTIQQTTYTGARLALSPRDSDVAIQTDRTCQRPGHVQLYPDLNHPQTRQAS